MQVRLSRGGVVGRVFAVGAGLAMLAWSATAGLAAPGAEPASPAATITHTIIPVGQPYGIALDAGSGMVYVSNYPASTTGAVSVIAEATNTVVATIPVGGFPRDPAVNPKTRRVYVVGTANNFLSVIDEVSNAVIATIPLGAPMRGDYPSWASDVDPVRNLIYVGFSDPNSSFVAVIAGATNSVITKIPQPCCVQNRGIAVNPLTNRIYVSVGLAVEVLDGASGQIVATIPLPDGTFAVGIAINPQTNQIYVGDTSGKVHVIDGSTNRLVTTISIITGYGVRDLAVDPLIDQVFAVTGPNQLTVIDGQTNTVVGSFPIGDEPIGVAGDWQRGRLYVADPGYVVALQYKP